MNNDKCILVEFANEDNSIAVGFQDWLVKDKDSEDLKIIVKNKTLVEILWPSCEIKSAQQMKKIVKSLTKKDWITSAVRILAYGEWTDMHRQLVEIEKFDINNPSKKERKRLMKKSFSDNEDNYTSVKKPKHDSKFHKKLKVASQEKIAKQIKDQKHSSYTLSFTSSEDETVSSSDDNYKSLLTKKKKEEPVKNVEIDMKLQSLSQKVNEVETVTDRILKKLQVIDKNLSPKAQSISMVELTETSKENNVETIKILKVIAINDMDKSMQNEENINQDLTQTITNIEIMPVNNFNQMEESKNNIEMADTIKVEQTENTDENAVPIGRGISIPDSVMKKIRTSDVGKMTCDLMSHLFTTQEIACSSRTGKKGNKVVTEGSLQNKSLSTSDKFLAMKDHVLCQFKTVKNAEELFKTAVSNKCKNVARNLKKKTE
ncbi:uncharacterized protein LOC120356874 [Solenopsis invicta]|uniref:uncharacterized protein LOC120356874 n=1 Tax=Solenopsis invicta TaxID=13686 RepID=UPI00193E78A2|nr:uncharacterized protein LOC120356874 [Solenopsis invicta]XP_039314389.1 uncharacterized protein LOC120356874 [Solenopsis invicta]